jgi:EmrB/QacA subfamily drug resistance transporter
MSKRILLLLCVSIPSFMINLDANIVAVSLTSISHSLHADFAAIEWVISAYTLAFATLLMPAGALADRFGRKRMLVTGLAIFTVASGICGAAPDVLILNWARALQGAGAALQLSSALAILAHGFHGRERAKAFAFWGSVIGVAIMLGPVAGGLITQFLGWEWAFYVNLPIGVAMIALTIHAVTESKDPHAEKIDVIGVVTFSGFLGLLTWALIAGNREGWVSHLIVYRLAASGVLFAAFVVAESRQARPMIDMRYFLRGTYLGANTAAVAFAVAFLTMLTYLPFFFQSALGYAPLAAGLLMLPLAIPLFVVPRIVSVYFDHRASGRTLLSVGLGLICIGLFMTAMRISLFSYMAICWSMFVASIGAGILNGQIAKVGMTVIPVERAGMAAGISGTMRFSGVVVGFAALGAILFQRADANVRRGLPGLTGSERFDITRAIANGNVASATSLIRVHGGAASLARESLGFGYEGLLLAASIVACVATIACWTLVSPIETAPHEAVAGARSLEIPID